MKLAFGCDPNAYEMKDALIEEAKALGHEVVDFPSEDPIYANVAVQVAEYVVDGHADRGVLVCGTGIGVSIAANKVRGAYCACVTDVYQAQRATLSNNADLISMGSQVLGVETAKVLLGEYLGHEFDAGSRSAPKVARIREFEAQ
ncbi:MAG: RpiB/LacA/LacB family sugar-phosphate isomerase [Propioniciclava sp.]|jgi:ribose 5-phosphate isomerase B